MLYFLQGACTFLQGAPVSAWHCVQGLSLKTMRARLRRRLLQLLLADTGCQVSNQKYFHYYEKWYIFSFNSVTNPSDFARSLQSLYANVEFCLSNRKAFSLHPAAPPQGPVSSPSQVASSLPLPMFWRWHCDSRSLPMTLRGQLMLSTTTPAERPLVRQQ